MANNFADDARIIEFWRFENNLTAGKNGNDLTAGYGGVGYTSTNPLEGAYSLDLEAGGDQWAYRNDAQLSAGFPLKNGDSTKKVSWCCWITLESTVAADRHIISKSATAVDKASLALMVNDTHLLVQWGYSTWHAELWDLGDLLVAGQEYHIGLAVDGVAKTCLVRVWDVTAGTVTTYTTTFTNTLNITDLPFTVGRNGAASGNNFDGLIDEVVVANDLLSAAEFDQIRQGTFGAVSEVELTETASVTTAEVLTGQAIVPLNETVSLSTAEPLVSPFAYLQEVVSLSAAEPLVASQGLLGEAVSLGVAEPLEVSQGNLIEAVSESAAEAVQGQASLQESVSLSTAEPLTAEPLIAVLNEAVSLSAAEGLTASQGLLHEVVSLSTAEPLANIGVGHLTEAVSLSAAEPLVGAGELQEAASATVAEGLAVSQGVLGGAVSLATVESLAGEYDLAAQASFPLVVLWVTPELDTIMASGEMADIPLWCADNWEVRVSV